MDTLEFIRDNQTLVALVGVVYSCLLLMLLFPSVGLTELFYNFLRLTKKKGVDFMLHGTKFLTIRIVTQRYLGAFRTFFLMNEPPWGLVYSHKTGEPIEFAMIDILDVTGQLVKSMVSDKEGRYNLPVLKDGEYRLVIRQPHYKQLGKNADFGAHEYDGEAFNYTKSKLRGFDIPMSPTEEIYIARFLGRQFVDFLRNLTYQVRYLLVAIGLGLSLLAIMLIPTILFGVMLVINIVSAYWVISVVKDKKKWGRIYSTESMSSLKYVKVEIYSKSGKLVNLQISTATGEYGFNQKYWRYYLKLVKPGYKFPSRRNVEKHKYRNSLLLLKKTMHRENIAMDKIV